MSKVKIQGNASGTGIFTVSSPNSNTDREITLPDGAGEILLSNGDGSNLTGISASGTILQVLTATDSSDRSTTSQSFVTGSSTLTVNITPASTSSKFYIQVNTAGYNDTHSLTAHYTIYRDSTNLSTGEGFTANRTQYASRFPTTFSAYDSPNTTSQITYQAYFRTGGGTAHMGTYSCVQTMFVFEIGG